MDNDVYLPRIIDSIIERYLKLFGAIVIEGSKYCGKTWVARRHAKSEILLRKGNEDSSNIIELAKISPMTILEGDKPRLIDEWQFATNLWDEIRYDVDKVGKKGQYILTGSSTPKRNGILHSGAGRFCKLHLRTMSLYESGDSTGDISLKDICDGVKVSKMTGEIDIKKLAYLAVRGGWPANINLSSNDSKSALVEYLNLIIDDDLDRLDNVKRDKRKIRLLLKSLARNESTTVSFSKLKDDISNIENEVIDVDTISSYLSALDRLFLFDNDEPFSVNVRSGIRVKQNEKRHFADPSLACALLNLSEDKLIYDLNTFGFIFEAMVERDLKIYASSFGGKSYHYQDYNNREIDHVIELEDGSWCAFEIKLGANKIESAAKNLLDIKKSIEKDGGIPPKVMCVICGLSNAAYIRPDGVVVVPITALKN